MQVQVRTTTSPGHIRPQPAHIERIDLHAQGDAAVKEQRREGPFERSFANISVAMPRILLEPAVAGKERCPRYVMTGHWPIAIYTETRTTPGSFAVKW